MTAAALAAAAVAPAPSRAGGAWLEEPVTRAWNRPGASIPVAPPGAAIEPRCSGQVRPATSPEDRAIAKAGWALFGPYVRFAGTSVVSGMSGADGMCRPLGYQMFVFVEGRFAGTLSPAPMDSRADGAADAPGLYAADRVTVTFRRYAPADPLCCPSGGVAATFRIAREGGGAVVVLESTVRQKMAE